MTKREIYRESKITVDTDTLQEALELVRSESPGGRIVRVVEDGVTTALYLPPAVRVALWGDLDAEQRAVVTRGDRVHAAPCYERMGRSASKVGG